MVNLAERIPLGYLFAESYDRFLVVPVHPEYLVQTCAAKQFLSALVGRDRLEFATAVSRRDKESNKDAQSCAVDVIHRL
jgi:hypothetical protein